MKICTEYFFLILALFAQRSFAEASSCAVKHADDRSQQADTLGHGINGIYIDTSWVTSVNVRTGKTANRQDMFFAPLDVLLIENYRSGLIWNLAKSAPKYQLAFTKAGLHK